MVTTVEPTTVGVRVVTVLLVVAVVGGTVLLAPTVGDRVPFGRIVPMVGTKVGRAAAIF